MYKDELYTATNKGINIYNFKTDSLFHLYESDGLPSNTVFDLKVFNDTIYAATEAGLSVIPVSVIPHQRSFPLFANPVIANNDTIWNKPESVTISDNQPLTLILNALSYGTKSPVKYFYRIPALDTNYQITSDPRIHLSNLSHGKYTLQARAQNSDGVLSTSLSILIIVKPYFYQTIFFKAVCSLAAIIFFILIIMMLMKRTKARAQQQIELERKIRSLELAAWKVAINPHFLFNSIQTMQSLYFKSDFKNATKFTSEFTAILRKTIDHSDKLFITVHDEVKYLGNYLELEKIKRPEQFTYEINLDNEDTRAHYLPSLVIQPVVENSLKHGIKDMSQGAILITFRTEDQHVICTIKDNGKGFNEEDLRKSKSRGLQLLRDKINIVEKLVNTRIEFCFSNLLNAEGKIIGTQAIFKFSLNLYLYGISNSDH